MKKEPITVKLDYFTAILNKTCCIYRIQMGKQSVKISTKHGRRVEGEKIHQKLFIRERVNMTDWEGDMCKV